MAHSLGAPVVVLRKFDPVRWIALVKEHRVTNSFSAPTNSSASSRCRPTSWRKPTCRR